MRDTAAKRMVSRKRLIVAVLVGAVTLVAFTPSRCPSPCKYRRGRGSADTITASRDIVDEISTGRRGPSARCGGRRLRGMVWDGERQQNIAGYYKKVGDRPALHDAYTAQPPTAFIREFNPANVNWDSFLTSSMKANVRREWMTPACRIGDCRAGR